MALVASRHIFKQDLASLSRQDNFRILIRRKALDYL